MATVRQRWIQAVQHALPAAEPMVLPEDASALGAARQMGLDAGQLNQAMAQTLGVPFVEDLRSRKASATFLEKIPIGYARRHRLIGLATDNEHLEVALADSASWPQLDVLGRLMGKRIQPVFAPPQQIAEAINLAYQERSGQTESLIQKLDPPPTEGEPASGNALTGLTQGHTLPGREDLLDLASRAPVIQLVNLLLFEAVKQLASDLHIQPYEDKLVIRMRIDGVLFDAYELPKAMCEEMISRVKVMGAMNIAEKRLPQDGRATVQVGDRVVDLRVASLPTSFGERVVIRLLDKSARLYTLGELGMPSEVLDRFRELINFEHGLILVTGPTGGGKSTTLYAALQELNAKELNILTLEDPIEYQLPGVSQTQINNRKGMTFASGLRNVLRQDPDIIMVGEIRDHETAVMAIQSALTGHLVFSTLHTNDAASAVTRLLDLGIEPYLAASSVVGVLAQRLVRRICSACARPVPADATLLGRLGLSCIAPEEGGVAATTLREGVGCPQCRQTGYRGRVGVFELLTINDAIRRHIQQHAAAADIKLAAMESGMRTLRDDGATKVLAGQTTAQEIFRITMHATA